jgi:hypothetical protein
MSALAVFIGYHANWIRERRAVVDDRAYRLMPGQAPGFLWAFAEAGYREIGLECVNGHGMSREQKLVEAVRIAQLFPEAEVISMHYPMSSHVRLERPRTSAPNSLRAAFLTHWD